MHARIVIHPRKRRAARLVDLNSLNGCFVNDARVHNDAAPLASGDVLKFGYDVDSYRFFFPEDVPRSLLGEGGAADGGAADGGAAGLASPGATGARGAAGRPSALSPGGAPARGGGGGGGGGGNPGGARGGRGGGAG